MNLQTESRLGDTWLSLHEIDPHIIYCFRVFETGALKQILHPREMTPAVNWLRLLSLNNLIRPRPENLAKPHWQNLNLRNLLEVNWINWLKTRMLSRLLGPDYSKIFLCFVTGAASHRIATNKPLPPPPPLITPMMKMRTGEGWF